MDNFDLNLLRIVVAIHDAGSVSAAAQRLDISQPAASAALKRLREALGDPLFVKVAGGMEPTPRALVLVDTARDVLARVGAVIVAGEHFDPATSEDTFNFAMSDVGEMVFLPKILDYLQVHAPGTRVCSLSLPPAQVEEGLQSGSIDLAIGYFPDLQRNTFYQQRLFTHRFVCVLRSDHPIRARKLSLAQFLSLGHVVVHAEGRSQEIFEQFLKQQRIERKVVLHTPHFMSLPTIIARSDLVATVPHAIGMMYSQPGAGLRMAQPPFDVPGFDLKQHWHRKYHLAPKNRWLRGMVTELFNDAHDEWRD